MTSWTKIEMPEFESEGFIETLLDKTCILGILDRYGVQYEECSAGNFTHRGKCPFSAHAQGDERTASFFISEDSNSFYCFGCSCGGNSIDFIKIFTGKPYYEAVRCLSKLFNITESDKSIIRVIHDPEKTILTHIMRAGSIIRKRVSMAKDTGEYNKWCRWADKRFDKMDKYLDTLDDTQWEVAKKYHDRVVGFIAKNK